MTLERDEAIVVEFEGGRGRIVGYVSRAKKICAIVLVKRRVVAVPLGDLRVVRPREKE